MSPLAENNHASLGDAPVALHVIRVVRDELKPRFHKDHRVGECVFDEKLSLRHTADFGGNVDEIAFSWWSREEDGRWKLYGPLPPGSSELSWRAEGSTNGSPALNSLDLVGSNPCCWPITCSSSVTDTQIVQLIGRRVGPTGRVRPIHPRRPTRPVSPLSVPNSPQAGSNGFSTD